MSPPIQRPQSTGYPLVDDPLAVPDGGVVAQGVQPVTVRVSSARYVQHPGTRS